MQLDGKRMPFRPSQRQKGRRDVVGDRKACRFERTMTDRMKNIENALLNLEGRIQTEVDRRVAEFFDSAALRTLIDERVNETVGTSTTSSSSSDPETSDSDSTSCDEEEPSCSTPQSPPQPQPPHYPNKWEFISTLVPSNNITDFRLEHFTQPVKRALKMRPDAEVFPRMSLEEMIEHDHPTTSDSPLFDEQKVTCKTRPAGKVLLDEEFFCLAPCCSASRLYQAATCPFLPSFVKKRMVIADDCDVYVQQNRDGIELVTPIRWRLTPTIPQPPPSMPDVVDPEVEEEEEEEEDPLADRKVVEQLMHEYFIPTPSVPNDDLIFGPYLKRVRESDDVPTDLLRSLVRRVNSNLDNSYKSHQELELFAELDNVPVDEKYGRLPFDPTIN